MAEKPKTIDHYLSNADEAKRPALQTLKEQIRTTAPDAKECISYGQSAFRQGRIICGSGTTKKHCALSIFSGNSLHPFAQDIKNHHTGKGSLRFQPNTPRLVCKPVKARLAKNDRASQNSES